MAFNSLITGLSYETTQRLQGISSVFSDRALDYRGSSDMRSLKLHVYTRVIKVSITSAAGRLP